MLETHWLRSDGLNFVALTKALYLEIASVTPVSSYLREIAWRQRYPNGNQIVIHIVEVQPALVGKNCSLDSHIFPRFRTRNLGILPGDFFRKCKRIMVSNDLFVAKLEDKTSMSAYWAVWKSSQHFFSSSADMLSKSKRARFHSRPHQYDFGSHCWPIWLAIIVSAAPKANFNFEYHSRQRSEQGF